MPFPADLGWLALAMFLSAWGRIPFDDALLMVEEIRENAVWEEELGRKLDADAAWQ